MRTRILQNGDMVITIPKEEKEQQLRHLNSLVPANNVEYDEITVLMDMVSDKQPNCQPTLRLIIGGKQ